MTPETRIRVQVAQTHPDDAHLILTVARRPNIAAREAYLGVLGAARAIIAARTGKAAKTHTGTRSEISRLAHLDPRIDRAFTTFLADGFEIKSWADYGDSKPRMITTEAASLLIAEARRLLAHAEWLLAQPDPPAAP